MMNRIDDEPIRFWLENRALIQEWAALENEVQSLSCRLVGELAEDIDESAPSEALTDAGRSGRYEYRRWYLPEWLGTDGIPLVGVAIGWSTKVTLQGSERVAVGLCQSTTNDDGQLGSALVDGLEQIRADAHFGEPLEMVRLARLAVDRSG